MPQIECAELTKKRVWGIILFTNLKAEVAEQSDALRSGRSEGSLVWVRLPPSAFI